MSRIHDVASRIGALHHRASARAPGPARLSASRYAMAVVLSLGAFGATAALKRVLPTPSFLFFIPAIALSSWYGGRGPGLLATALSVLLIDYAFLAPVGSLDVRNGADRLEVTAFLIVALTVTAAIEALRNARGLAETHASDLDRANVALERQMADVRSLSIALQDTNTHLAEARDEAEQVAARVAKLLEVTAALSEAQAVEDVAAVVLDKGLAVAEASRGVVARADGDSVQILGMRGYSPEMTSSVLALVRASDAPLMDAIRTGALIWLGSADEFRQRYRRAFSQVGAVSETQAYAAVPLIHSGETVGGLAMTFGDAAAFGAADRAFTLLLAQAAAGALHRARGYDAERERRRQAELLAHAREDVLGVVAHDLRNPLNLISMTNQLLIEVDLPAPRRKELLEKATRAAKQMNRLIGDLLDTVRLEAGRLSLDVQDVPVGTILSQAEDTFRPIAEERRISFETTGESASGAAVRADPLRVSQVVGNLLGNALKFTPQGGRVTLRVAQSGAHVVFQVVDSGPGIPPEQVEHLFDRFWQARTSDHRGVGLGLAIAKGIVEAHGERIWVESTLGAGTTFSFTLQVAVRARAASSGPSQDLARRT